MKPRKTPPTRGLVAVVWHYLLCASSFWDKVKELKDMIKPIKQLQSTSDCGNAGGQFDQTLKRLAEGIGLDSTDSETKVGKKPEWHPCHPRKYTPDPEKWVEGSYDRRPMLLLVDAACPLDEIENLAWRDHVIPQPENVHDDVEIASAPADCRRWTPLENWRNTGGNQYHGDFIKHPIHLGTGLRSLLSIMRSFKAPPRVGPFKIPGIEVAELIQDRDTPVILEVGDAVVSGHLISSHNVKVLATAAQEPENQEEADRRLPATACCVSSFDVDAALEIRRAANNLLLFVEEGMDHPIGRSSLESAMVNIHELTFLDSTCQPERERLEEWLRHHGEFDHTGCLRGTSSDLPSIQPTPESACDRSGDNQPEQ
jgi:hypothetical protein